MATSTIIIKVRFPPTCPIASKTFNVDSNLTVRKAVIQIADQVKTGLTAANSGFYIPERQLWLDDQRPIAEYASILQQVDGVEFKDRATQTAQAQLWQGFAIGAVVATVSAVAALVYMKKFKA